MDAMPGWALSPLEPKTFNNAMTPLRSIWAMATKTGRVSSNITLEIDSRKGQQPPPDPLAINEVYWCGTLSETTSMRGWRKHLPGASGSPGQREGAWA